MAGQSRRSFLQHSSLGVVVVGAAALTPALLPGTASAAPVSASVPTGPAAAGPLPAVPFTAYVKDHRTGEVAVMVGEHEVLYRDRELAARLARIASHAK